MVSVFCVLFKKSGLPRVVKLALVSWKLYCLDLPMVDQDPSRIGVWMCVSTLQLPQPRVLMGLFPYWTSVLFSS